MFQRLKWILPGLALLCQTTWASAPVSLQDAALFLTQGGFGGTKEEISALHQSQFEAWLEHQKQAPVSYIRPYFAQIVAHQDANRELPGSEAAYARTGQSLTNPLTAYRVHVRNISTAWMRNLMKGEDQLRQRVAWALSEIFVVSFANNSYLSGSGMGFAHYYDMLANHAFGTYADLLYAVSTDPLMAYYLSALGNQKAAPAQNRYPDENYAREVMQLFSIGLWELNPDGSLKLDAANQAIPSYDNRDITALARVFTGAWLSSNPAAQNPRNRFGVLNDIRFDYGYGSMIESPDTHDTDAKTLFPSKPGTPQNVTLAAGQDMFTDIRQAVDVLANHPNTAPFISRALIQFLVTSNPQPAYIQDIASRFLQTGGDLFEVVKAILLHPDARQGAAPTQGKLQSPLLRIARLVKAFPPYGELKDSEGNITLIPHEDMDDEIQFWTFNYWNNDFAQLPFFSPSVFNFYQPGYSHKGPLRDQGIPSPEFQILNSLTLTSGSNRLSSWIDSGLHTRANGNTPRLRLGYQSLLSLAESDVPALVDTLDLLLANGRLSSDSKTAMITAIEDLSLRTNSYRARDIDARARAAIWLAFIAPQSAIASPGEATW